MSMAAKSTPRSVQGRKPPATGSAHAEALARLSEKTTLPPPRDRKTKGNRIQLKPQPVLTTFPELLAAGYSNKKRKGKDGRVA